MINNINIKNFLIISSVTIFIFLWPLKKILSFEFDVRYSIFILFFFIFKDIVDDFKKKNFKIIFYLLIINSFFLIHYILVDNGPIIEIFIRLIFLNYIFLVAFYYHELILKNKKNIIIAFILIFLISIIVNLFYLPSANPEPHSCAAIKKFFWSLPEKYRYIASSIHYLSSYSLVYKENSHLAMVSTPIILYALYYLTNQSLKKNYLIKCLLIIFMIIIFLKSSATLLGGLVVSSLAIILFENRRSSWIFTFLLFFLSLFLILIFFTDKICVMKILPVSKNYVELTNVDNDLGRIENLNRSQKESYEKNRKNRESNPFFGTELENIIQLTMNKWKKIKEKNIIILIENKKFIADQKIRQLLALEIWKNQKAKELYKEKKELDLIKKSQLKITAIQIAAKELDLIKKSQLKITAIQIAAKEFIKSLDRKISLENEKRSVIAKKAIIEARNKAVQKEKDRLKSRLAKNNIKQLDHIISQNRVMQGSQSASVFYHNLKITKQSILEFPLGWGFNNYEKAANYFNKKTKFANDDHRRADRIDQLNKQDGTNNFFKMIVEFGYFGLFAYFAIFLSFLSKKITLEDKIFLFPFILTQSIRGAGYFNGGFLLILFIICIMQIKKINNDELKI